MLTDVSLYWLTATAASSGRFHDDTPRGSGLPCRVGGGGGGGGAAGPRRGAGAPPRAPAGGVVPSPGRGGAPPRASTTSTSTPRGLSARTR